MKTGKSVEVPCNVPLLCLSSALTRKAPLNELASWVALSLTLDGRDKITKIIQYSCRFLTWFYTSTSPSDIHANCYKALYKSLTESRKAYRLGRTITEFHKLRKTSLLRQKERQEKENDSDDEESSWWRNPCTALKLIGLAGFWLGDNLFYLTNIGFLDSKFYNSIPRSADENSGDVKTQVLSLRKQQTITTKHFAARCYFLAVLVGLYANIKEVLLQRKKLKNLCNKLHMMEVDNEYFNKKVSTNEPVLSDCILKGEIKKAMEEWEKEKEQYFIKLVALAKVRNHGCFTTHTNICFPLSLKIFLNKILYRAFAIQLYSVTIQALICT